MNHVAVDGQSTFMPLRRSAGVCRALPQRGPADRRRKRSAASVLEAQPNLPEAEHLLGVIAHQNGKLGEAIEHVQRATELAPQVALFHANLGEMLRLAGRPRLAVEAARRALEIEPNMPAA